MQVARKSKTDEDYYARMRRLILGGLLVVPIVPFLLALGIGYYSYSSSLEQNVADSLRRISTDHARMIDSFLSERRSDLSMIMRLNKPAELSSPKGLDSSYRSLLAASHAYIDLGLINPDGIQTAYSGPYDLAGRSYADAKWYRQVLEQGQIVSDVFLGYRRVPHFIVAVSLRTDEGVWVLRATVDQNAFDTLVGRVGPDIAREAYILDSQSRLQAGQAKGTPLLELDGMTKLAAKGPGGLKEGEEANTVFLFASHPVNDGHWELIVRQPREKALEDLRGAGLQVLGIMLVGGLLITIIGIVAANRISEVLRARDLEKAGLEHQLVMAARLAELGEMATGFAHEINNPLQVMKSDMALMELVMEDMTKRSTLPTRPSDISELSESLEQIKLQVDRCAAITAAILKFGRQGQPQKMTLDLAEFLPEVAKMVSRKASVTGIDMQVDVPHDIPRIVADPGEIQQVLLNLLNNGIYAVTERHGSEGGRIFLGANTNGNGEVVLEVDDNGSGISPENLGRVFTPFFTTKPPGKGTGLGLPVCFGIIERMGGTMEVESEKGRGTTFRVRLPASA